MSIVLFFILGLVCISYFGLLSFTAIGWIIGQKRLGSRVPDSRAVECGVTIVIAFRNEEGNLQRLIEQLKAQDYSSELLEIILVNDNSTDDWRRKVELPQTPDFICIDCCMQGKKNAIHEGINHAKYDIILTTDADCWMSPQWIRSMMDQFTRKQCDFLFGPVALKGDDSFLSYFQSLDYMAMATFGAGAANVGAPFLCSGANLMFYKHRYLSVFKELHHEFLSGDDVFLLHAFKRHNFSISFAHASMAVVVSEVQESWSALINQRIRWGSKAGGYRDSFAIAVSVIILLENSAVAMSMLIWPFFLNYSSLILFSVILKITLDSLFVSLSSNLFGFKNRLFYTLASGVIYPFWISFIAFKGFGSKGVWKGR